MSDWVVVASCFMVIVPSPCVAFVVRFIIPDSAVRCARGLARDCLATSHSGTMSAYPADCPRRGVFLCRPSGCTDNDIAPGRRVPLPVKKKSRRFVPFGCDALTLRRGLDCPPRFPRIGRFTCEYLFNLVTPRRMLARYYCHIPTSAAFTRFNGYSFNLVSPAPSGVTRLT